MIHLVTLANRHLYVEAMADLHRLRRKHFVEERGWTLEIRDDGEYDAYDDDAAAYLIGFSAQRAIEVACRLRSTASGGVLPDIFPHLVAESEPDPATPGTYECTRYFAIEQISNQTDGLSKISLDDLIEMAMADLDVTTTVEMG